MKKKIKEGEQGHGALLQVGIGVIVATEGLYSVDDLMLGGFPFHPTIMREEVEILTEGALGDEKYYKQKIK